MVGWVVDRAVPGVLFSSPIATPRLDLSAPSGFVAPEGAFLLKREPKMAAKSEPELLKVLNSRAAWNLPPHREPVGITADKRFHAAVDAHARANRSDPFARDRVAMYLKRGLELPSDILEEANGRMRSQ